MPGWGPRDAAEVLGAAVSGDASGEAAFVYASQSVLRPEWPALGPDQRDRLLRNAAGRGWRAAKVAVGRSILAEGRGGGGAGEVWGYGVRLLEEAAASGDGEAAFVLADWADAAARPVTSRTWPLMKRAAAPGPARSVMRGEWAGGAGRAGGGGGLLEDALHLGMEGAALRWMVAAAEAGHGEAAWRLATWCVWASRGLEGCGALN